MIATVESTRTRKQSTAAAAAEPPFRRAMLMCHVVLAKCMVDVPCIIPGYLTGWGAQCEFFDTCIRKKCCDLIGGELVTHVAHVYLAKTLVKVVASF